MVGFANGGAGRVAGTSYYRVVDGIGIHVANGGGPAPEEEDMAIIGWNSLGLGQASVEGAYTDAGAFPTARLRIPLPRAGVVRRFRVSAVFNNLDGSCVLSVAINGVATALTLTYAAGETGDKFIDIPVSVVGGDEFSFLADATATTVGQIDLSSSAEFVPTP